MELNRKFVSAPVAIAFAMIVLWILPHVGITPTEELQRLIIGGALAVAAMIIGGDIGYDWVGIIFGTQPLPDAPSIPDIFNDILTKNEGKPPVALPDNPQPFDPMPETFEPVIDNFRLADNSKEITWHKEGHPQIIMQSPFGYTLSTEERNTEGEWSRPNTVNVQPEYGIRLNITSNAQIYRFKRDTPVSVDANRQYLVSLEYIANVTPKTVHPFYNWIQARMTANGQYLQPNTINSELIDHEQLANGRNLMTWIYTADKTEEITLAFEILVHWANAEGSSRIDITSLTVQKKA